MAEIKTPIYYECAACQADAYGEPDDPMTVPCDCGQTMVGKRMIQLKAQSGVEVMDNIVDGIIAGAGNGEG